MDSKKKKYKLDNKLYYIAEKIVLQRRARKRSYLRKREKKIKKDFVDRLTWACSCRNVGFLKDNHIFCSHCGKKILKPFEPFKWY